MKRSKVGTANNGGRAGVFRVPVILRAILTSPAVPEAYRTMLVVQAYLKREFPGGREALCEATIDDVTTESGADGIDRVYIRGVELEPYGAKVLAWYMRTQLAGIDSPWLFPQPRNFAMPVHNKQAEKYIRKAGAGTLAQATKQGGDNGGDDNEEG